MYELNFVNNMLGHTQFELGKLTVQSKPVLPTALLASVEDVAAGAADLQGMRITEDFLLVVYEIFGI